MSRTSSSLSDNETLCYSETEIASMATNECTDDTDLAMFKQHVEIFEKECCEELSDYDDWAPDEKIPAPRKLKGTRLVDADIDLWRMRKTERHAGFTTTPKKRARARSFREKRVALLSQATQSSDSECHADDESDDVPSAKSAKFEMIERELVPIVQADLDVHLRVSNKSLAIDKISPAESQFSTPRISSSKLQQYRRNSTAAQLL